MTICEKYLTAFNNAGAGIPWQTFPNVSAQAQVRFMPANKWASDRLTRQMKQLFRPL
jgi:hypothetical protein